MDSIRCNVEIALVGGCLIYTVIVRLCMYIIIINNTTCYFDYNNNYVHVY